MKRSRKKASALTPKQLLYSAVALLLAFLILVLLNEAIGGSLPLPGANDLQRWMGEISAQTGLSPAPVEVEGGVTVHYIDVGQADCELIQTETQTVLIDAGDQGCGDLIAGYLNAQKVEKIDLLIATHPHADHIGSMAEIVKQFDVGKVLFSELPASLIPTTKTYERLLDAIADKGLRITKAKPGECYDLGGGAVLTILGPVGSYPDDLNDNSVVCRLDFGESSFLFTGDAGIASEDDLLRTYGAEQLRANLLKLGHHGSSTASQEKWLNAVQPQLAVACVGYDNSYGHPHAEVLERLEAHEIALLRTDKNGSIVVKSDGQALSISSEK